MGRAVLVLPGPPVNSTSVNYLWNEEMVIKLDYQNVIIQIYQSIIANN